MNLKEALDFLIAHAQCHDTPCDECALRDYETNFECDRVASDAATTIREWLLCMPESRLPEITIDDLL